MTGFDETVRKITLNVVKGIFYLLGDLEIEALRWIIVGMGYMLGEFEI